MNTEHSTEETTSVTTEHTSMEGIATEKGKGKAIQEHTSGEEDSSDDDDGIAEENVEEPEEDDLADIDTSNIIQGGRTRGKNIDWTAVEDQDAMDDDDDDDEEYHAPVEDDDAMRD